MVVAFYALYSVFERFHESGRHIYSNTINTIKRPVLNLDHTLGYSADNIDDIFLFFPRKQDLIFHADCLHLRQFA